MYLFVGNVVVVVFDVGSGGGVGESSGGRCGLDARGQEEHVALLVVIGNARGAKHLVVHGHPRRRHTLRLDDTIRYDFMCFFVVVISFLHISQNVDISQMTIDKLT